MKTSMLILPIAAFGLLAACTTPAPVVSAQEQSSPVGAAMSVDMDKQMSQMQEKMKAMQGQMDKIHKTTDPKERQKLMQEHMQAMQENMKAMRGMGGPMMMGGNKGGMMEGDMMQRHGMMEKHMNMMQMMMDQMMQHDQAMGSMPAK